MLGDEDHSFIACVMRDPVVARSSESMDGLVAGTAGTATLPPRSLLALRLVDLAMLMLRVAAILVLLSPLLGLAILLG